MFKMTETIVETKACTKCWASFTITDKDVEFYDKISPIFAWKKYQIPSPTFCPDCRQQRRLTFRNERKLYKRTCDASGKSIISIYSPDKTYKVYDQQAWRSDNWDPLSYGRDIDFGQSFFQQFYALLQEVPRASLMIMNNENCDYVNQNWFCKDCYLCFDNGYNEKCWYENQVYYSQYIMDSIRIEKSQILYDCLNVKDSYKLFYCQNCANCSDSYFLKNCSNCNNCFACMNLVAQNYCIFNKQYTKEEYDQLLAKYDLSDCAVVASIKNEFAQFVLKFPHKNLLLSNTESSSWDYLSHCTWCQDSFAANNTEDSKHVFDIDDAMKNCMDINNGAEADLMYEWTSVSWYKLLFDRFVGRSENVMYCDSCLHVKDCFGCAGLHSNQQYCILNKQYTKEEYEEMVPKIITHMITTSERWEFFDPKISPIGYNETVAQEYFPLTKETAIQQWFKRSDYESPFPHVEKILKANELPNIQKTNNDILDRAIECEITGKPFRITKSELEFYRTHNLPLPRKHPDQRHLERMQFRNPRKLRDRTCVKCWIDMKTTYRPESLEIIYCESCYNKEIYG